MVKILDYFNCVRNFWQKIIVFMFYFDLHLFGFSLEMFAVKLPCNMIKNLNI